MDAFVKQLSAHLPFLIALGLGAYWIVARAKAATDSFRDFVGHELEERLPRLMKQELQNGLGDMIEARMRKALEQHAVEDRANVREEIARLEERLTRRRRG